MAPQPLSVDQIGRLKKAGFNAGQITNYQKGVVTPAMSFRMLSAANGTLGSIASPANTSVGNQPPKSSPTTPAAPKKKIVIPGIVNGSRGIEDVFTNILKNIGEAVTQPGGLGLNTDNGGQILYTDGPGAGGGGGYPTAPATPDIKIPVITPHDFLPQATEATNRVYQPVFDALSASKENAGTQGERTRQIVGGLWDNMRKDIATKAAETAQQYDSVSAATQTAGDQLSGQIASNYGAANTNTGTLMKQLGLDAAAPSVMGAAANDQAWQQGTAATNTAANVQALNSGKQNAADYDKRYGQITGNQGAVAQADIANQVAQQLYGIDQNVAQQQFNKGSAAIDMAQQLSAQDLSSQQSNAGFSLQGQGMQNAATQTTYENQVGKYNTQSDEAYRQAQAASEAAQRAYENQRQANNDIFAQMDSNRTYEAGRADASQRATQDAADAAAKAATTGASGDGGIKPTGINSAKQQVIQAFPTNGSQMFEDAQWAIQDTSGAGGGQTKNDYVAKMRNNAVKAGYDQNQAAQVAQMVWEAWYGKDAQ